MTAVDATCVEVAQPGHTVRLITARAGFLAAYKPVTRRSYADGLDQWIRWCSSSGVDPLEAERPHLDLWARHLEENRQLMPGTVLHRLCVLRSFYRYCEDEQIIARSPARIRLPKVSPESSTHGMTRQEAVRFLIASERNPTQHALVCLLLLNGLRISEALGADIADLGVERGHRTLRIVRKGGKRQTVPLSPKTARSIDLAIGQRTTGPLFLTKIGTRVTRYGARDAMARIGRRAGLTYRCHPHLLRHAFITTALDAGALLHDVQDSAGHADPRTTTRYWRHRGQLDRNSTYLVTAFLAAG